jgi:hypothetical protein
MARQEKYPKNYNCLGSELGTNGNNSVAELWFQPNQNIFAGEIWASRPRMDRDNYPLAGPP